MDVLIRHAKRIVLAVVGTTVLILGILMLFLPGPAVVVIPLGLAILGTEFVWARRLLSKVKSQASRLRGGSGS